MDFLVTSFGGKNSREIMVDSTTIAGTAAEIATDAASFRAVYNNGTVSFNGVLSVSGVALGFCT